MKKTIIIILSVLSSVVSNAQTACDSLDIDVKYAAFSDSLIEISVTNHGSGFYSYPGFVIFNTNGDTVAKEDVNLFGIGAASTHVLKIFPGMITSSTFTGTLQLWSGFFTTMECSYNLTFKLCPDSCAQVYPFIGNMGGALSLGTVNWTVQDSASTILASGSFTLDNNNQIDQDTVCLIHGNYFLHVSGLSTPMAGQPIFGMTKNFMNAPNPQKHYSGSPDQLPFSFYRKCSIISGIGDVECASGLRIFSHDGVIDIQQMNGKRIGEVAVYSLSGQVVWRGSIQANRQAINLSTLPSSLYIIGVLNEGAQVHKKLFLGN